MDIQPNEIIKTQKSTYTIHHLVGSGRFSKVYEATDKSTKTTVVIKALNYKDVDGNFDRHLYLKELNILSKLRTSPLRDRYVHLKDAVQLHTGAIYFVMERLGITLHFVLKNIGAFPLSMCKLITIQIAQGLVGLKCMGIVHADLKPDNIMFCAGIKNSHLVKIIDFGWSFYMKKAKIMQCKKFQAVPYRAPEVCFQGDLGYGLDVWALGCIMPEIVTGIRLFDVKEEEQLIRVMLRTVSVPALMISDMEVNDFQTSLTNGWFQFRNFSANINDLQKKEDALRFTELVYKMLTLMPNKRITAVEALAHPFLTMKHFIEYPQSCLTKTNADMMKKCSI